VVVTADHESGGLSITGADEQAHRITGSWTTSGHSANVVPIFAAGPNAEAFGRVLQNSNLPQLAVQGWGVKNFAGFARP
jgi:alkaline phosphatase